MCYIVSMTTKCLRILPGTSALKLGSTIDIIYGSTRAKLESKIIANS